VGLPDSAEGKVGRVIEVECLDAIRTLLPPIGSDAKIDVDGRCRVTIGRVMIVDARVQFDMGPRSDMPECAQIDIKTPHSQGEESLEDGRWVIRKVQNFSRIVCFPSSKQRFDGQPDNSKFPIRIAADRLKPDFFST